MASISNKIKINFNDFSLLIYVVGGQNGNGEGILILFLHKEQVIHTISIDCCKVKVKDKECNLLDGLLRHHCAKKIDCFVWTHPHDDHSEGLDNLIETYYKKGCIGVIPKQIYGTDYDIVNIKPQSNKVLRKFNSKFKRKNLKSIDCQCQEKRLVYSFDLEDSLSGQIKTVNLYCLTPIDFILDDKRRKNVKISDSQLNEISLSLILDIDGYCFFFGGDVTDSALKDAEKSSLYSCRWIKIPHHGSTTTNKSIQYFNRKIDSAVTTSFLKQNLPKDDVLKKYKDITNQIYITQKSQSDVYDFGMVSYAYSFKDSNVQLKVVRYGNAYKYV